MSVVLDLLVRIFVLPVAAGGASQTERRRGKGAGCRVDAACVRGGRARLPERSGAGPDYGGTPRHGAAAVGVRKQEGPGGLPTPTAAGVPSTVRVTGQWKRRCKAAAKPEGDCHGCVGRHLPSPLHFCYCKCVDIHFDIGHDGCLFIVAQVEYSNLQTELQRTKVELRRAEGKASRSTADSPTKASQQSRGSLIGDKRWGRALVTNNTVAIPPCTCLA